jgi:hypothetical protein
LKQKLHVSQTFRAAKKAVTLPANKMEEDDKTDDEGNAGNAAQISVTKGRPYAAWFWAQNNIILFDKRTGIYRVTSGTSAVWGISL